MDHSPQALPAASDFAHTVEGAILLLAAGIALIQAAGIASGGMKDLLWPALILSSAGFLASYLILHHGWTIAGEVFQFLVPDPQQRQHLLISLLGLIAGASEVGAVLVKQNRPELSRVLKLGLPLSVAGIAAVFLLHEQHGTAEATAEARAIHQLLAVVFLAMATLRVVPVRRPTSAAYAMLWPIGLAIGAVLPLAYREPIGSYEPENTHAHSMKLAAT